MKKILVLVFSNLKHDARVTRQVNFLRKENHVTIVCFDAEEATNTSIVRIKQTELTPVRKVLLGLSLLAKQFTLAYKLFHDYGYLVDQFASTQFDLIIANDIDALPLAFKLKKKGKVIFDAHEYAPRHFENNKVWKIFFQPFNIYLCKKYIPQIDGMLTVGKGLAQEYEKNLGRKPLVITNATRYHNIEPSTVEQSKIRLIHHGIANPSRRLDLMIDMMEHLDERFTLDLILMTSDFASSKTKSFIENLKESASKNARIKILPPVKSHELVQHIMKYDVGVFLLPPINFNYANTLPNKLFDFIQARLGIAIGPTPEMAEIVNHYGNGVVSDDFTAESLAKKLNALTFEDVKRFKNNSGVAAKDLNAENNEAVFQNLIQKLLQ
jgi:glycosyltransferase involved in cell wall biosynthesis